MNTDGGINRIDSFKPRKGDFSLKDSEQEVQLSLMIAFFDLNFQIMNEE